MPARFKVLDAITDIDLADPVLMEEAGLLAVVRRVRQPFAIFPPTASSGVVMSDTELHN